MIRKPKLESPAAQRQLLRSLQSYVEECRSPPETDGKHGASHKALPTLAGFCRFLGIGIRELERLEEKNPEVLDCIRTVLEDELLNHSPSPTLLNSYMKRRLGYSEERARETSETECGKLHLIFEHDIEEDGV
ncbi:MAG: hypothetical protein IJX80_09260 [Clostridia bacterium]|nr:hypothetical protein [Clostridia bacterium]